MTKRRNDNYEECLRTFVHAFHARNLKHKRQFVQALKSSDSTYAKGYAYGLNEALLLLKEIVMENDIPPDSMGFESVGLDQILTIVESPGND